MAISRRAGVKTGVTLLNDENEAAADLFDQIAQPGMHTVLFFCSPKYDAESLGSELKKHFSCKLLGCTTAGEVSSQGYVEGGIVAVSFSGAHLKIHSCGIHPLSGFTLQDAREIADSMRNELVLSDEFDSKNLFGMLLVDGLSFLEEQVISYIHSAFQPVSIIGGSAADGFCLQETKVCIDGEFMTDAAVLILVETTAPFAVFKTQHLEPTDQKMVVTRTDPAKRIVCEINAEPAAEEYARILGIPASELGPAVFSKNPVMIRIADSWQVRSIKSVNPDKSLSFHCAIDAGLVLTLAKGFDIIANLKDEIRRLLKTIPEPQLVIAFDCAFRRLEIIDNGLSGQFAGLVKDIRLVGFNTYGEQFNSVHVNQTLVGVVIGGEDE
ncbi:Uncharacterized conserved protein, contains FIST_N domain [Desulfatibacillum alkenivorans DSM 16219]|jgi:hypothetical protein|uniref:Uncharacterized conserved protein, contains FIST_N domain n=1 Tax=Desulfatibacillum alkenivorans DSM 16219 TaxID=1121393 RepID=A0A1M6FDN2_9BACT|nr:FIST N-terminal domain-containing protein [Desulfatibacillum alkenivorans]SHI95838.1 Uncharacterized conserved protein, contains FIST_N domain [Desulfatibacillum alkenivorans DSM 16219]